ncbi:hypothetical protein VKT23_013497 [Stygiomarasmius scandens]|uniref:F-box domain-containing protein n=1 Tax=Marasmiellus scandens TaxID=2682957 RepID=A0ABR1J2M6_9AGAR
MPIPISAELTDLIIDAIDNSECETLQQISLVSKLWRPRSQYKLFSKTINLVHPGARHRCGTQWSGTRRALLSYVLEFLKIARGSRTISSAVRGLVIPDVALNQSFPFDGLRKLEVAFIADQESMLGSLISDLDLVSRGHPVRRAYTGAFPREIVLQNPRLQQLMLTNMVLDEAVMLSMFQALGADKECSSLSVLGLNACHFTSRSPSVRREPHRVNFRDLTLVIGDMDNADAFVDAFDIQGLRSLCFATDVCPEMCANVINKHCSQLQRITFLDLPCCVAPGLANIHYDRLQSLRELYITSTFFHHNLSGHDTASYLIGKIAEAPSIPLETIGLPANSVLSNNSTRIDGALTKLAEAKACSLKEIVFRWETELERLSKSVDERLPNAASTDLLVMVSGEHDGYMAPASFSLELSV